MANSFNLQDCANAVESELCAFDIGEKCQLKDEAALRTLELLQDRYYFHDINPDAEDKLIVRCFNSVNRAIEQDFLEGSDDETISKVIATVYSSYKRRTVGHREYLDFIHEYVGTRLGTGIRAIRTKSHDEKER